MVQTSFGFNGRFWPIGPLFQGLARWFRVFSVVVLSEPEPAHLSA